MPFALPPDVVAEEALSSHPDSPGPARGRDVPDVAPGPDSVEAEALESEGEERAASLRRVAVTQ